MKLLTTNNAKTVKGEGEGYKTAILYLAPSTVASAQTVCAMAKLAGCEDACLYTAGRGRMVNTQQARIAKTNFYHSDRAGFIAQLADDIAKFERAAKRDGLTPVVRLNGTSDIPWERTAPQLFEQFAHIQFYDYTKFANRSGLPGNYHLTWSYSGASPFYAALLQGAINAGLNIATVFRDALPREWHGRPVVNGDANDLRFLDPRGVIVGLLAKGNAKRDASGFVQD